MGIWPEVRASYRNATGLELAHASLDVFIEHTLWYLVNSSDYAMQKREALTKALSGESVEEEGGPITIRSASGMMDQLDEFEAWRTNRSVE
jgi:hypothetical protein